MKKLNKAFTLIELLVVIAIIAILAAILFPVLSQARLAAKQSAALNHMRQLGLGLMMYAGDNDDMFLPSTLRGGAGDPLIWTQGIEPYIKNKDIFIAPDSQGGYASKWSERHHQSFAYSDACGVDPASTAVPGAAAAGTEGFSGPASFSNAEETARVGLFAVGSNSPKGVFNTKHRGYVFNPYNGLNSPDGDYSKGLPLISDVDLVTKGDARYPNSPTLSPGFLKPIFTRYAADGQGNGRTPVVFADGHAKILSSNQLNAFGTVVWRFR